MSNILIIEDEKNLARFVELELKHEGYNAEVHYNGRTGLDAALNNEWDAILLDLMLPELNGLEVCRRVRQVKNTPIIMMTARDSVIDRVSGLDHGADDYIVKPFAIEELLARDVLLNKVWGYETEVETNVVDVYIRYLRNKIDVPGEESYIQTVRGTGYVMRS